MSIKDSSERTPSDPAIALVRLVEAFDRDEIESFEMNITCAEKETTLQGDVAQTYRATGEQEWVIKLQRRPGAMSF